MRRRAAQGASLSQLSESRGDGRRERLSELPIPREQKTRDPCTCQLPHDRLVGEHNVEKREREVGPVDEGPVEELPDRGSNSACQTAHVKQRMSNSACQTAHVKQRMSNRSSQTAHVIQRSAHVKQRCGSAHGCMVKGVPSSPGDPLGDEWPLREDWTGRTASRCPRRRARQRAFRRCIDLEDRTVPPPGLSPRTGRSATH